MGDTVIGVDLAKRVFQIHGAAMDGQVKFRKKLTREQFRPTSPKWHAVLRQGRLIRRVDQAFCRP